MQLKCMLVATVAAPRVQLSLNNAKNAASKRCIGAPSVLVQLVHDVEHLHVNDDTVY